MTPRNLINSRILALACIAFVLLVLSACSGGGGRGGGGSDTPARREPAGDNCGLIGVPDGDGCRIIAVREDVRATTPFTEDGEPISLEVVLVRPLEPGRYPTVVFHHGSTGNGSDPSLFRQTFTSNAVTRYFVERGWMVAFPQRRGRGKSDGLYDEGFTADRSSYSCREDLAFAGARRALEDLDAITDWIRLRPEVDTTRMLVGGSSRGGVLAVTHTAELPDIYLGAINFVGGWIAEGCGDYRVINRRLFVKGAAFPGTSLWIYSPNDSFYSLPYSRNNFAAYSAAGGLGTMHEPARAPGLNGHFVVNDRELWAGIVDGYLESL